MVLRRMEMSDVDDLMGIFSDSASTQRAMEVSSTSRTDACLYPSDLFPRPSLPLRHRSSRSLISASAPLLFGS